MKPLVLIASLAALLGVAGLVFTSVKQNSDPLPKEYGNEQSRPSDGSGVMFDHSGTAFGEISVPTDCSNECALFPEQSDQYAYCRSVCGLSPIDPEKPEASRSPVDPSLEAMIRQKDEAIRLRDITLCQKIADSNLRTACEVRVTEDLLE